MSSALAKTPAGKKRPPFGLRLFLWGLSVPMCAGATSAVMRTWEFPIWVRIPLSLVPLLPLIAALRVQKEALADSDELARHIARDAFAFAFYALFGLFICVDLLRGSGVLPGFTWTTKWLVAALGGTLVVGYIRSGWRFR